ncbi:threonine ammonia-lyase [Sphingomicrobium astaxanthinifaciens]|uniref:threonine ammonia-lyase n=1 Tax=Sphingomicrobium astaxanthinifaciens TaxID=1227949 RepID=UPI001FCAD7A9|nr:threonine/serine dehydratase [Sphingomicrobium astaxanthinifaciens]MCJ7422360.1 threonine/serine dehydratase [Sphingomicrobium astaxanthinifaciens]
MNVPDLKAVEAAARRISGAIRRTPLSYAAIGGVEIGIKWENRQEGGAFKLRGASNRLLALSPEERQRGVVAFSSGNHARGVAIAARRLGMPATIVMPADAPRVKLEATLAEGAEVIPYDRLSESREEIAARLAAERGATLVPSFDDPFIVAGQGTVGLELLEQARRPVRRIIVCCGGGGLAGGIALACPEAEIVIVEPAGWDDMARSLESGHPEAVAPDAPPTLCDAIQTFRPAQLTVDILRQAGASAVQVDEDAVRAAVRWAWKESGEVVEPGGSVALAALLSGVVTAREGDVAIVSGGNIDPALHAELVAR